MQKNKFLTIAIVLLLILNVAAITMFLVDKYKHKNHLPQSAKQGNPVDFLLKELQLDAKQQAEIEVLLRQHRSNVEPLREKIKDAKQHLFNLLKQGIVSDSVKQDALQEISKATVELDLLTFNHFVKVRLLCSEVQQKKFDEIIEDVTKMMAQPRNNQRRPKERPLPNELDEKMPPPPRDEEHQQ